MRDAYPGALAGAEPGRRATGGGPRPIGAPSLDPLPSEPGVEWDDAPRDAPAPPVRDLLASLGF